jgi:hypothetical protein
MVAVVEPLIEPPEEPVVIEAVTTVEESVVITLP